MTLATLFENNRHWAARMTANDPEYFRRLARQQAPQYLWIGCADSRVPANEIVGLAPGELFVHRNVANVVVPSDLNCLAVLQFAIDVLGVRDVIVCGHYGCGGVRKVLADEQHGLVDDWLQHVADVRREHAAELARLDPAARADRLCELNVVAQAIHVARSTVLRSAWAHGATVTVHGVIYRLDDGLLQDLGVRFTAPP
jgi:carbonic anhydrase